MWLLFLGGVSCLFILSGKALIALSRALDPQPSPPKSDDLP